MWRARAQARAQARTKVVRKCKSLLWMLGSVPLLTEEILGKAMSLAVAGVIGFYGRSTVITFDDCQKIEAARAEVVMVAVVMVVVARAVEAMVGVRVEVARVGVRAVEARVEVARGVDGRCGRQYI